MSKKTMLSAIQPYSVPTLGNYLGAIRNWVKMQDDYRCFFFGVDLHAITLPQDPHKLLEETLNSFAFYFACGLDSKRSTMFLQSHIHEHTELAWILLCSTYMGELSRMTQYKDKSKKQGTNIGVGLFAYPVLMASDILLYKPDFIPVGEDQKQHVELARDLAQRFNRRFNQEVFTVPKHHFGKSGTRIMDLQNPSSKMSKSNNNVMGTVYLNDSDKQISKKIKSAMTDSGTELDPANMSAGLNNLVEIFASCTDTPKETILNEYQGRMYGYLKKDVAEAVVNTLAPIREETERLKQDRDYIIAELHQGAKTAASVARKTLKDVFDIMGLVPKAIPQTDA